MSSRATRTSFCCCFPALRFDFENTSVPGIRNQAYFFLDRPTRIYIEMILNDESLFCSKMSSLSTGLAFSQ